MIKSLKEIDEQLEVVESSGISYEVNPSQFIQLAAPLLIKICELAKVFTGNKGDKILNGVIAILQGLQIGTFIIKQNNN